MSAVDRAAELRDVARLDRVVLSPKRLAILALLYLHGPMRMADLREALGLTWGDLDSNVRALREAGYVEVVRAFGRRPVSVVRLTPSGRARFEEVLARLEGLVRAVRG